MAGSLIAEIPPVVSIPSSQQHILGLDTVRAFAALSVMLAHILGPRLPDVLIMAGVSKELASFSKYLFTGLPAVIVFFVVSGFCIHYPYTRRNLPLIAFTAARWMRIMPPALAAMALAQILHIRQYNFIDGYILWSIVCELWYYSLYPFFLLFSRKVSFERQFFAALLISLVLVAYLGTDQYGNAHIYGPGLNWLVMLPSWLLGCVLANRISGADTSVKCGTRNVILWRASVAMTASILFWLTLNTPIGYYLTMNFFAVLVFFWIRVEILAPKKNNSLFERIGKWSYSVYLFHMVFLSLLVALVSKLQSVPFITIPVILCLCYMAYRIVEKPSHELARNIFRKYRAQFQYLIIVAYR